MKKRKDLPVFGRLNLKLNADTLGSNLSEHQLLDYSKYNDINYETADSYRGFLRENFYTRQFTIPQKDQHKVEKYQDLYSNNYKQYYFTELKDEYKEIQFPEGKQKLIEESMKFRLQRLDPKSPNYSPLADEKNYGQLKRDTPQFINEILKQFKGQVCRVRLAVLNPKQKILPHIDYETDYIIRFHIPILTNPLAKFYIIKNGVEHVKHLQADGTVFFVNTGYKHWVSNEGSSERVHLIVDVHGQEDLKTLEELV